MSDLTGKLETLLYKYTGHQFPSYAYDEIIALARKYFGYKDPTMVSMGTAHESDIRADEKQRCIDAVFTKLHDEYGRCGHCGKKECAGKSSNSVLPHEIAGVAKHIEAAIKEAQE